MKEKIVALALAAAAVFTLASCAKAEDKPAPAEPTATAVTAEPETGRPKADGAEWQVGDLYFYLPDEFKPYEKNGEEGTWYFFTAKECPSLAEEPKGVEVVVTKTNELENIGFEDWVLNWSAASTLRLDMFHKTINGVQWIVASHGDDQFYYALFNKNVYEVILRKEDREDPDGLLPAARKTLEKTLFPEAPAVEEPVTETVTETATHN